jgi:hypothetical protein
MPGAVGEPNASAPTSGFTTGPGPETAEILKGVGESTTRQRDENIKAGEAAKGQQVTLARLKQDAPNIVQGPFAHHYQQIGEYARLFDPSWNGQVASYEDFIKNAGALTRQAVHDTSPRAAVQEFKLIGSTLPEPDLSPRGLQQVANEYMGLNDYKMAKVQAQTSWENSHGGHGFVQGFEPDWQKNVSPYAFVFNRMDPQDQHRMVAQLNNSDEGRRELGLLANQLKWLKSSGLEPMQ